MQGIRDHRDRGAAAVEFALVALLLVTLLMGVMEFGRMWAIQGSLAQASRDAARTAAITDDAAAGAAKFNEVFSPLAADGVLAGNTPVRSGTPGDEHCVWKVDASYQVNTLTRFFADTWTITAKGAMRCNG
ncbi:TadE family protein [Ornithinimicrobium sp. Y1694]|uniref:TadE family protein n=1 Tax=Ornithinimicrobium sp. Y1694 TaxID=3418590 RepID=UPI003CE763A0